jgi:hypothetical protein
MDKLAIYNKYKDQMKTGDLLQWRSKSALGWAIRLVTGARENHSSLVIRLSEYEGLERRRFTQEALEHGIVLNLLSRRLENHKGNVWWYPLKDDWSYKRQEIGEKALFFAGTSYDYKSLFKQLFTKVSADARDLFCSELCFICYGYEGIAPNPGEMTALGIFKEPVQLL